MNNTDIKKILDDLYSVDPSLKAREQELIPIIRAMAIKPEAYYDATFAANLRTRLLAELAENKSTQSRTSVPAFWNILTARPLQYAILGVAVIVIGAVAITELHPKTNGPVALNSPNVTIQNVSAGAFGSLSSLGAGAGSATAGANSAANPAVPSAAATPGVATPMNAVAAAPTNSATKVGASATYMPVRPPVYYNPSKYDYTGNPITQTQAQLNVLKKVTTAFSADQATTALEQAGFGGINLSAFANLGMSTVTLVQNQPFGYQISIDFVNGTISIDQNYNEWPQDGATTTPLTASDIPSDSAVIATANQFFASHGISTENYATPEVTHDNVGFAVPLAAKAAGVANSAIVGAMPMIPYYSDSEQVLYPLMVNGINVYDTSGNKVGLTVEVNVRYNRVANVYGLETETYQSSAYDAITDASTIISMAESTPSYPMIYNVTNDVVGTGASGGAVIGGSGDGTVYDLGTPTMAYAEMYQADSQGQDQEFLVPAYVFPVTTAGTDNASTQNIVVPLIKDFEQQNNVVIPGRPIPMTSGGSGGGASAGSVSNAPTAQ